MGQAPSGTSKKSTEAFTSRTAAIRSSGTFSRKRPLRIGTIRKKLARTLRGGRNPDYKRHMRELLETWSLKDISGLVQEYESLSSLKEIIANSDLTRQSVPNLRKDLSDLYEKQCYTDIVLEYKGSFFPVHQAIVSRRCPFFEKKLTGLSEAEKTIKIDLDVSYIDTQIFSLLIKFLYTGECHSDNVDNEAVLKKLGEKFGMPKSLDKDLKSLLENETLTDIILVFPSKTNAETCSNKDNSTTDIDSSLEFKCHGAILCARSRYFRSLLTRISKTQNFKSTAKKPLRITVDETMLPRQYVPVVLQCMYLDCIDLHSIIKWKSSDEGNGNGEADKLLTTSEIAMELFEIGKFLDFPALSQGKGNIFFQTVTSKYSFRVNTHWIGLENLYNFILVGFLLQSCMGYGFLPPYDFSSSLQHLCPL